MYTDVTADEVKKKMANLKVKLYTIIVAYNISGNDNGNLVNEDAGWEILEFINPNCGH